MSSSSSSSSTAAAGEPNRELSKANFERSHSQSQQYSTSSGVSGGGVSSNSSVVSSSKRRSTKKHVLDDKHKRVLDTLVHWSKQQSYRRVVALSRAFYRWCFIVAHIDPGAAKSSSATFATGVSATLTEGKSEGGEGGEGGEGREEGEEEEDEGASEDEADEDGEGADTEGGGGGSGSGSGGRKKGTKRGMSRRSVGEQKQSYLILFAENEKLREQLAESKRAALSTERSVRVAAVAGMLSCIMRSRFSMKKRYYYDLWFNNTRILTHVASTAQDAMQLNVGLQRIESERNYVKQTETMNTKLQLTLGLTLCYFKWKSKAAVATLFEERRLYEKQRRLIFRELVRIREIVSQGNQREAALLQNALQRGENVQAQIVELHTRMMHISGAGGAGETDSGEGAAGVGAGGGREGGRRVGGAGTGSEERERPGTGNTAGRGRAEREFQTGVANGRYSPTRTHRNHGSEGGSGRIDRERGRDGGGGVRFNPSSPAMY